MSQWFLGLDLGQAQDFSALIALEQSLIMPDVDKPKIKPRWTYDCRHIHRWKLGTSYPDIVRDVAEVVQAKPLLGCTLVVDGTGVGKAVVDMFREAKLPAKLRAILITAGHAVTIHTGQINVPKKELASTLVSVFQSRRLRIANLPERKQLIHELTNFKVKVTTAGNETFESWRTGDHDDIVLALACAMWLAEKQPIMSGDSGPAAADIAGDSVIKFRLKLPEKEKA